MALCQRPARPGPRRFRGAASLPVRLALAAGLLLGCAARQAAAVEKLRIGGTGSAMGLAQRLAPAFERVHPGCAVEVLPSLGSAGGIKALAQGAIEVAFSARPPREEESRGGLVAREFGRTPLALVTGRRAVEGGFNAPDLARIYSGEISTWPDGERLRVVMRPASETDTELVRSLSPQVSAAIGAALVREGMLVALNDQENATVLGSTPGALGFVSLAQIITEDLQLVVLPLQGARPEPAGSSEAPYPLRKPFYAVISQSPSAPARAFLEFLFSPEGRRILERSGTLPFAAYAR